MTGQRFFLVFLWTAASLLSAAANQTVYEQAVTNLQEGHPEAAISILEPLLQSNPGDLRGLTLMGMAVAAAGKLENANSYFERALRARPAYLPALKGLAMNEMTLKQYSSAKSHFEQLVAASPADPAGYLGLGRVAAARGDSAGAASAIGNMPDAADSRAHFEAGLLLASLKSYHAAARQFELALPGYPDPYLAGFNLVLARVKAENYAGAIAEGEKLIAAGQTKGELYNLLSEAYEKSGDTKRAYDSLRTATQIEPSDETNYIDLINLCIDHKNYDLASEIARVGLAHLPASERIHLQFGVVFAMKEQFDEAQKEFETAQKLAPGRSLPYVALALILMQMNQPAEAAQRLRDRVRQTPDDYLALWYLGEALNRGGTTPGSPEQKEAISALKRSVQLNPDISQSHELLGKLLYRDGRLDEAASQLELAIRLDPANEAAIYQLAQVYRKKGDTTRAKPLFAKVGKMKAEERENFAGRRLQQIVRAGAQ